MRNGENKDAVLREIAELTDTQFFPTLRGGTIDRRFVDEMAKFFGVSSLGNKATVLSACLNVVGLPWRPHFDSARSKSGGGGTVTQYGLVALRNAVIDFLSYEAPQGALDPAVEQAFTRGLVGYLRAPEIYNHEGEFSPGQIDPDALGEGFERHNRTQNSLATLLQSREIAVLSPKGDDPKFDLYWTGNHGSFVCEVKSITNENSESQLRKAVGQVLRYQSQLLALGKPCGAVVVTDEKIADESWLRVFYENKISLIWGPDFPGLENLS